MVNKWVVGLSAAGGAIAIAIAVLVIPHETKGARVSSPGSTQTQTVGEPTGTQAHEAVVALAKLASDPASLVATGAGPEALAGARAAVPAGSRVVVSDGSWAPDGAGGGTVMVTVTPPQGGPVSYAAVMVHEAGGWKVLATFPLASSRPADGSERTP
jgi:hypothetical protein